MVRTQIQLTEEQVRRLKRRAAERGVSMAALIREAIDEAGRHNGRRNRRERMIEAVERGRYRSGLNDVSVEHDEYLADAFDKRLR